MSKFYTDYEPTQLPFDCRGIIDISNEPDVDYIVIDSDDSDDEKDDFQTRRPLTTVKQQQQQQKHDIIIVDDDYEESNESYEYDVQSHESRDSDDSDADYEYDVNERDPLPAPPASSPPPLRRQNRHRSVFGPLLFISNIDNFEHSMHCALTEYYQRAPADRCPEALFVRPLKESLGMLVGKASAWVHSSDQQRGWDALLRGCHTIDNLQNIYNTLKVAIHMPYFEHEFYRMSTNFHGIDKTVETFGY